MADHITFFRLKAQPGKRQAVIDHFGQDEESTRESKGFVRAIVVTSNDDPDEVMAGVRFDSAENLFASGFYETPGWQRAQRNRPRGAAPSAPRREPLTIDGTLVAASTAEGTGLAIGMRVFHQKFGYGHVVQIDGNKLTVDFDKAGQKKVVDSFVARV